MSGNRESITYALDFCTGRKGHRETKVSSLDPKPPGDEATGRPIPRIARLMALAIRFEGWCGLKRSGIMRNWRLGRVTRARMTQITKLLNLAPDIQERILFLPPPSGLNERNLRPVVSRIGLDEQRRMFQKITAPFLAGR
jgi:hypothetical protein